MSVLNLKCHRLRIRARNSSLQNTSCVSYNSAGGAGCKLTFYGNERTMNLNPLILTNIQGSPYFKVYTLD